MTFLCCSTHDISIDQRHPDHHRQRSCTLARCASSRRAWVPQAREPVRGGSLMLIPFTVVALLALMLSGPANAQVHVDIGIRLPAPPQLVVVPGAPAVRYAPAAPARSEERRVGKECR